MPKQLAFELERDSELCRLLDSKLDPAVARACTRLLDSPLMDVLTDDADAAVSRVASLCWYLKASAQPGTSEDGPLDERERQSLLILAGLGKWAPLSPVQRGAAVTRQLRSGRQMDPRTQQRVRKETVERLGRALFDVDAQLERQVARMAVKYNGTELWSDAKQKYAGGLHPPGQFSTMRVDCDYWLDSKLLPYKATETRIMRPTATNIEYWSYAGYYSGGNRALRPIVEGAECLGIIGEDLYGFRRYGFRFNDILNLGDPPIEVKLTFEFDHSKATGAPAPLVGIPHERDNSETVVSLRAHFDDTRPRRVYFMRTSTTTVPHFIEGGEAVRRLVKPSQPGVYATTSKPGVRAGYTTFLYWPSV